MTRADYIALGILGCIGIASVLVEVPGGNKELLSAIVGALAGFISRASVKQQP